MFFAFLVVNENSEVFSGTQGELFSALHKFQPGLSEALI